MRDDLLPPFIIFLARIAGERDRAFARTCACCQDIVMSCPGSVDRIQLVLVKLEWFILAVILAFAKDAAAFGMQDIRCYKLIDSSTALKGWIELNQRIGPEDTLTQTFFDLFIDSLSLI
jgi:hypothetical protein